MDTLYMILTVGGTVIMAANWIFFFRYILHGRGVLTEHGKRNVVISDAIFILMACYIITGAVLLIKQFFHPVVAAVMFAFSITVFLLLVLLSRVTLTVKEGSLELSELLVGMIETRDPNINGHSRYVMNVVSLFYDYLPDQIRKNINKVSLEYAALMHNIGNIGVPESILSKSEKLSLEEWSVMYQHPRISSHLFDRIPGFDEVKDWILYHHERVDGNGYYKLNEGQIPLASKIIAVADTYAALTSRRSFRRQKTYEQAIKTIREAAGSQLDEQLVEYFCRVPGDKLKECRPGTMELF